MGLNFVVIEPVPCRSRLLKAVLAGAGHRSSLVDLTADAIARLETGLFDSVVLSDFTELEALSAAPTPIGGAVVVARGRLAYAAQGGDSSTQDFSIAGFLGIVRRVERIVERVSTSTEAKISGDGFALPCRLIRRPTGTVWFEPREGADEFDRVFRATERLTATLELPEGSLPVNLNVRLAERSRADRVVRVAAILNPGA